MAKYLDLDGLTYYHGKIKPSLQHAESAYGDTQAFKNGDKALVSPVISTNAWDVNDHINHAAISGTYTGTAITVPTGANVKYTGKWKWTADKNKKSPESVTGNWGNTLPASATESAAFESLVITTNNAENKMAASVTLSAKRKGLMLNGQKIIGATGDDVATASAVIYFRDNLYYGPVTTTFPDSAAINTLNTTLVNGKNRTVPATTTTSQYFCYAYPKSYGAITSIIADGVDQIKANFREPLTVSVTNKAGLAKDYYVYVSVNLGAFNNNSLAFS